MNQLDLLYRALLEYRKNTTNNQEVLNFLNVIKVTNEKQDKITLTKNKCNVDIEWIEAIEEGIVHIEKAIKEERQFITSEGEVVEIEKVKSVSRESVEHLAKHSDLITRITEGEDLTPDKLYTVEKLSDYAIYENRFLYMLLCYLRDFISLRYDKIIDKVTTYTADTNIQKNISFKKEKMSYELKFHDVQLNDPIMTLNNPSKPILDRIDVLLKTVLLLLKTPLMEQVAKAPMLRPPVTRTNVLKMNKNFKGALALYEYITAYNKIGYEIIEYKEVINPFTKDCSDEFADIILLTSFLTYEHGNNIKKELHKNYLAYLEQVKKEEKVKFEDQLRKAKRLVQESKLSYEEYILMLEQRNRQLEKDSILLEQANNNIKSLQQEIVELNERFKLVDDLKQQIEIQNQKYIDDMNQVRQENNELLQKNNSDWEVKLDNMSNEYKRQINEIETNNKTLVNNLYAEISKANEVTLNKDNELKEALMNHKSVLNEKRIVMAELNGLRRKYNLPELNDDNFTNENRFKELEEELIAFTKFFNEQWKLTKPKIRKEVFKNNPYVPKSKR